MANNNTIGSASVQIDAKMTQSQVEKEVSRITRILEKEKKKMDKALDLGVHINANSAKAAVTMYDTMIKKVNEYIRLKSIAEKSFMVQKSLSSSLVTSKTGYTDLDKRIAENAKFRKGTSAPAIEDEKIIKAIRKESAAEALADERRLKQAVADRLSLSIQGAKQTKLLPDNVYKDAKAKVDALKTALLDLTAQRSMKLDAKQVLTLDSQIKATQLALNNLVSSPKSMSNTKLLGTMPKQLDQFKVVIQELEKRMGALNLKNKYRNCFISKNAGKSCRTYSGSKATFRSYYSHLHRHLKYNRLNSLILQERLCTKQRLLQGLSLWLRCTSDYSQW